MKLKCKSKPQFVVCLPWCLGCFSGRETSRNEEAKSEINNSDMLAGDIRENLAKRGTNKKRETIKTASVRFLAHVVNEWEEIWSFLCFLLNIEDGL